MANEEHLAILRQGVEVWNEWREDHPVTPNFSGANYIFAHGGRLVATMQRLARVGRWLALGASVIVVVAWGGGDRVRGEILVQPVEQAATGKPAVVGAEGADLYDTPDGVVVTLLSLGTTLTATGRTADNQWLLVKLADAQASATQGWVEAAHVIVFNIGQLPVVSEEALEVTPAATSTARVATATPTRTPLITQTPLPKITEIITDDVATQTITIATVLRNANLRAGPGTTFAISGKAKGGDKLNIVGANAAGDWYQTDKGMWIAAFLVKPAAKIGTLAATGTITSTVVATKTAATPTKTPTPGPLDMDTASAGDWPNMTQAQKQQAAQYWVDFWAKNAPDSNKLSRAEMETCIATEVTNPDTPKTMLLIAISSQCLLNAPPAAEPAAPDTPTATNTSAATNTPAATNTQTAAAQGQAFTCVGGCAVAPGPSCAIKGNVNSRKEKIYHAPGWRDYNRTDVNPEEGDRWFCTEQEAVDAGFRAPLNH